MQKYKEKVKQKWCLNIFMPFLPKCKTLIDANEHCLNRPLWWLQMVTEMFLPFKQYCNEYLCTDSIYSAIKGYGIVIIVSNYKCTCPHKYICFIIFLTLRICSFKNIYHPEKKRRARASTQQILKSTINCGGGTQVCGGGWKHSS